MKKLKYIVFSLAISTLFISCKNQNVAPSGLASLNIINASTDIPTVGVNFVIPALPFYKEQALVSYGSSANYGESFGTVPLTLVSSADTSHHFYQGNLSLASSKMYSMYIYGNLPAIQTMFLQDNILAYKDSVSGARFINLSPDAGPVNISIQGSGSNEFTALAYKSITPFKSYSNTMAVSNNGGYNFQVTDASGNVLATFNWQPLLFRNNTLVISGLEAQGNVQVFQVNNY